MSAVQFSNAASAADRRRRRMATETDSEFELPETNEDSSLHDGIADFAPFPMLSRDRLIRRVISPRLWKHITVAIVLTMAPIIYAVFTWPSSGSLHAPDSGLMATRLQALRGITGLKCFAAAQFCLVIAWVRSASALDFRGRYRWWRWMAIGLFTTSLSLLTDSSEWIMNLTAERLEPVFGRIDSARPALILVPGAACLALVLWRLIPDMGRCRTSQSLLTVSAVLLVVRAFVGIRQNSAAAMFQLSTLELLVSGIMLSALQLHARFVIHINPNPPVAVQRKPTAARAQRSNAATDLAAERKNLVVQTAPVVIAESSATSATSDVTLSVAVHPAPDQETMAHEPNNVEAPLTTQRQDQGKGKSGKKQKYRKAG